MSALHIEKMKTVIPGHRGGVWVEGELLRLRSEI